MSKANEETSQVERLVIRKGDDMWFGWKELPIGQDGMPSDTKTGWVASCFIFFTRIIYIGEVKRDESF